MSNIFYTADTHFGHSNIIKYCNRPYSSVEEMDKVLISNWNNTVQPNDTVYHLGDFCWGPPERYRKQLNGRIHLILGNHDKQEYIVYKDLFESYSLLKTIKVEGTRIVLCHFALRVWDHSHLGAFALYGHTHDILPSFGKSMDVGIDSWNYVPISHEKVVQVMDTKNETPKIHEDITPFKEYIWFDFIRNKPPVGEVLLFWDGTLKRTGYVEYDGSVRTINYGIETEILNPVKWMYLPNNPK